MFIEFIGDLGPQRSRERGIRLRQSIVADDADAEVVLLLVAMAACCPELNPGMRLMTGKELAAQQRSHTQKTGEDLYIRPKSHSIPRQPASGTLLSPLREPSLNCSVQIWTQI